MNESLDLYGACSLVCPLSERPLKHPASTFWPLIEHMCDPVLYSYINTFGDEHVSREGVLISTEVFISFLL